MIRARSRGASSSIGIAAERDVPRPHAALGGVHDDGVAVLDARHLAALVDRGARGFGGGGQPERVVQRMQVTAA
jgi:hypothetical protein